MLAALLCLAGCSGSSSGSDSSNEITGINEFTSVDLQGNEITQDVFAEADVTMINFWGTYCGPCISEMPELQKISEEYEGRAQVIGVVIDVDFDKPDSSEYQSALSILDEAGAKFRNIRPMGGLAEYMMNLQYVPTTIFVDNEGNIIGQPTVGADADRYRERLDEYLG